MSDDEASDLRPRLSPSQVILRQLAAGGISCMIASATMNPMDVIKVRLQTQGQLHHGEKLYGGFFDASRKIVQMEGITALGKGMTASVLREAIYSSLRLGLYRPVRDLIAPPDQDAGLGRKILAGLTTGAIGSCIANPTDVVKIRMQVQGPLKPGESPRYKGMIDAFIKIYKEEGVIRGYYKGVSATAIRAAFLTGAQMSSYDHSKYVLLNDTNGMFKNDFTTHLICSLISGFVTACVTSPVDIIKTRFMNDSQGEKKMYTGVLDCFLKTVKKDGPTALYRGWLPNYLRLGPHFVISLPLMEYLCDAFGLNAV